MSDQHSRGPRHASAPHHHANHTRHSFIEVPLGATSRVLSAIRHSAPAHKLAGATAALLVLTAVPALAAGDAGAGQAVLTGTEVRPAVTEGTTAAANPSTDAFTVLQKALRTKQKLDEQRKQQALKAARAKARADRAAKARALKIKRAKALNARAKSWVSPTTSGRVTTRFGVSGSMWSSGRHTGIDLKGRSGDAVRAIHTGVVIAAETDGPYGKVVRIRLANGDELWYAHLSVIAVKRGQQVITGDRIGNVGSTGNSTGPHLHVELHKNGSSLATNPLPYLRGVGALR